MWALRLTTLVGWLVVVLAAMQSYSLEPDLLKRRRILSGCIRTCIVSTLPWLLLELLPREDRSCGALIPALMWIVVINLLDSYLLFCAPSNDASKPASLRMEPSCITGLTFALCGYIGARAEHKYGHLFLYAVVACLACVLPSHNLQPGVVEEQIFESVQKSILVGCIALLIAGVGLVQSHKGKEYV